MKKKVIFLKVFGGLGNQMFQLAAGKALAHSANYELKIDISSFDKDKLRTFKLDCFIGEFNYASAKELRVFKKNRFNVLGRLKAKYEKLFLPWFRRSIVIQPHSAYYSEFWDIKPNSLLDGYWQSEKYFSNIVDIVRNEFSLKNSPQGLNKNFIDEMSSVNSVSLHVRRGDYASNPNIYCQPLEYYERAIKFMEGKISNPVFYIFSDDIDWVKINLPLENKLSKFINHNQEIYDYEDMRLMASCKHHIIANSSFSWWGAWLSPYSDKIVVAPKKWDYNLEQGKRAKTDMIPDEWIRL